MNHAIPMVRTGLSSAALTTPIKTSATTRGDLEPQPIRLRSVQIVCDGGTLADHLRSILTGAGESFQFYQGSREFIGAVAPATRGCVLADLDAADVAGVDLMTGLSERDIHLPVIFLNTLANSDDCVALMRRGAADLIHKPFTTQRLLMAVKAAMETDCMESAARARRRQVESRYGDLTGREKQILTLVVAGEPNKQIARHLDLSEKTIEVHRSRVMEKMHADSLAELVRMSILAGVVVHGGELPSLH